MTSDLEFRLADAAREAEALAKMQEGATPGPWWRDRTAEGKPFLAAKGSDPGERRIVAKFWPTGEYREGPDDRGPANLDLAVAARAYPAAAHAALLAEAAAEVGRLRRERDGVMGLMVGHVFGTPDCHVVRIPDRHDGYTSGGLHHTFASARAAVLRAAGLGLDEPAAGREGTP